MVTSCIWTATSSHGWLKYHHYCLHEDYCTAHAFPSRPRGVFRSFFAGEPAAGGRRRSEGRPTRHIVEAMNDESQDLTDLWQYHVEAHGGRVRWWKCRGVGVAGVRCCFLLLCCFPPKVSLHEPVNWCFFGAGVSCQACSRMVFVS